MRLEPVLKPGEVRKYFKTGGPAGPPVLRASCQLWFSSLPGCLVWTYSFAAPSRIADVHSVDMGGELQRLTLVDLACV